MKGKVNRVGADPILSLADMKKLVDEWIDEYGERAIFTTDAGYNNVVLCIDTRKRPIETYKKAEI